MKSLLVLSVTVVALNFTAFAQELAKLLPFQGRLTDASGTAIASGAKVVQFKIYNAPVGGQAVWNGEVQRLTVNGGLVSTTLGTKASLSGVDFNRNLYLELTIDANDDGQISAADPPLLPRQSIVPAVFALESAESHNSQKLAGHDWNAFFDDGSPVTGKISGSRLTPLTVGTNEIANGGVTASKIAAASVGTTHIASGAIRSSHIQNGEISSAHIADSSVTSADIADGNVSAADIADGTIRSPDIGQLTGLNFSSGGEIVFNHGRFGETPAKIKFSAGSFTFPRTADVVMIDNAQLALSDNGVVAWTMARTSTQFQLRNQTGSTVLFLTTNGNLSIDGTLTQGSDRHRKTDVVPVDSQTILSKVAALPLSTWRYSNDITGVRHLGPMAQDFKASFGLGGEDTSIASVDVDGVALAAIQGLHDLLKQKDAKIAALEQRLMALEKAVSGGQNRSH